MQLFVWFIVGSFAVYRLTWDLTSCTLNEDGKCEPNLEGPFRLYDGIRWVFARTWLPKWVDINCPFCTSMWVAGFFTLLLLIDGTLPRTIATWLVWTIGLSAPTAFWLRYAKTIYGVPPREF